VAGEKGSYLESEISDLCAERREEINLCDYYYDHDRAIAYKLSPVSASTVPDDEKGKPKVILIHTNIKITNFKKEKVRRTLSEVYPTEKYDEESAKSKFSNTVIAKLLGNATKISEEEYEQIKSRVEIENS